MNDDVVGRALEEIEALLPPRSTEYRAEVLRSAAFHTGALAAVGSRDEPATVPLTVPPAPLRGGPV